MNLVIPLLAKRYLSPSRSRLIRLLVALSPIVLIPILAAAVALPCLAFLALGEYLATTGPGASHPLATALAADTALLGLVIFSVVMGRRMLRRQFGERLEPLWASQVGVVSTVAYNAMTLGVAALVVSLALLAGFQRHVRQRLASETPHVAITPAGRGAFEESEGVEARLRTLPGVLSVTPVARGRLWLTLHGQAAPVEAVGRPDAKGLVLEATQARPLGAFPGDEVTLVSSRSRLSPLGPVPIVAGMTIEELSPAMTGRRLPEAILPLAAARRLFALGERGATGYEIRLRDPGRAPATALSIRNLLGDSVTVATWEDANRALVLALKLERWVLFATVFLIVVVAGLNLAATAAVLAATRAADAAVLSVLGATPRTVSAVFRWAGGAVGTAGTLAGVVIGVVAARVLDRTGAIPLPAQLYALSHVPFRVEPLDLLAVTLLSAAWSFLAASIPARAASRRNVSEVLRAV